MFKTLKEAGALLVAAIFLLSGCASYQRKVDKARAMMADNPAVAAKSLEPLALKEGRDQLVYLFDYATALQAAGQHKESIKAFLKADEMADYKDYVSISKQAASILLSQELVPYKGDDYEKIMINAMNSLNFLMLGDLDGALVETRRVIEKLDFYRTEAKRKYEQNIFAIYLGGLIWESDRKWDDAFISFEKAYKLGLRNEYIKEDLVRAAYRARRMGNFRKYSAKFGIKKKPWWDHRKWGELVLIYQQGWGPRKRPRPRARRLPKLYPVSARTQLARLEVTNGKVTRAANSQFIYSVQDVAIKTLDDNYAALVAKRMAGVVVKEVVAKQVGKKNEALGAALAIFMHATDRADLRQWSTLPATLQVARIPLTPGKYTVSAKGLNQYKSETGEFMMSRPVNIKAGRKRFLSWRSYQ